MLWRSDIGTSSTDIARRGRCIFDSAMALEIVAVSTATLPEVLGVLEECKEVF